MTYCSDLVDIHVLSLKPICSKTKDHHVCFKEKERFKWGKDEYSLFSNSIFFAIQIFFILTRYNLIRVLMFKTISFSRELLSATSFLLKSL